MEMIINERIVTNVNTYREEKTKEYDFREMAKVPEAMRGKMKRLQAGPRDKKQKEEFKKKTGIVLTKLVMRIQEMMPEIQMEKTGRRFAKHTIMMGSDKTNSTSQVEE